MDKTGDLIVDHTQFPDDFLDTAESMERRSFYGRCLGLHSASSEPSKAVIIHFHGGGFLAQTSQSHVHARVSPEHRSPVTAAVGHPPTSCHHPECFAGLPLSTAGQ
eukprot:scpid67026/ scgid2162/ 